MAKQQSMSPVYQPLHIARKDALHLWPETLLSLALLIAFAWAETQIWLPSDGTLNVARIAHPIIKFLLIVSWTVLVSRLVHDEELVGDRQFWITRPYTWYGLLLAKVLYLVVFIGLPFFIMQAWLLHHAGLYPTQCIPALLKDVLVIGIVALLPLLAIAAVTATFVRYISSVLVGLIYALVVIAVAAFNFADKLSAPWLDNALFGTLIAIILLALVLMYWSRKSLLPRVLLIAGPLIFLFGLFTPVNSLIDHRYPNTSVGTATFDPKPPPAQPDSKFVFQGKVLVAIPVQVKLNTLPEHSFILADRIRLTLDGTSNYHYTSDWIDTRASFGPEQPFYALPLRLPQSVFERIRNQPVALHIQFGTRTYTPGPLYSVNATEAPFPIPGHAACKLSAETGALNCTFPYTNPGLTFVSATVHDGDCTNPGQQSATARATLTPSQSPAYGFTPVEFENVSLGAGRMNIPLCPGTRTTFTPAVAGSYGRLSVDVPSITLDAYAQRIPKHPVPQAPPQEP
jgi:hypothetical protein